MISDRFERDRDARRIARGLTDQDSSGRCHRLEPARRIDQVAGDHPLALRAECDGRLAGQNPGSGLENYCARLVALYDARRLGSYAQAGDRID